MAQALCYPKSGNLLETTGSEHVLVKQTDSGVKVLSEAAPFKIDVENLSHHMSHLKARIFMQTTQTA
jgi:hypothetical protein